MEGKNEEKTLVSAWDVYPPSGAQEEDLDAHP